MADHVTKFKHPEDPQLGFLTIVAGEAVKEKKDLIVLENYWMCNLGTIFKKRLEHSTQRQIFKKLERERERENGLLKKAMGPCQLW